MTLTPPTSGSKYSPMAPIRLTFENPIIRGFTTNSTLMCKAGITDYEGFSRGILALVPAPPFSLEVSS